MGLINVKFVVAFDREGNDLENLKNIVSEYGEITDACEHDDGDFHAYLIFVTAGFADFLRMKFELNCVTAEDNEYVLLPMASLSDKTAVLMSRENKRP